MPPQIVMSPIDIKVILSRYSKVDRIVVPASSITPLVIVPREQGGTGVNKDPNKETPFDDIPQNTVRDPNAEPAQDEPEPEKEDPNQNKSKDPQSGSSGSAGSPPPPSEPNGETTDGEPQDGGGGEPGQSGEPSDKSGEPGSGGEPSSTGGEPTNEPGQDGQSGGEPSDQPSTDPSGTGEPSGDSQAGTEGEPTDGEGEGSQSGSGSDGEPTDGEGEGEGSDGSTDGSGSDGTEDGNTGGSPSSDPTNNADDSGSGTDNSKGGTELSDSPSQASGDSQQGQGTQGSGGTGATDGQGALGGGEDDWGDADEKIIKISGKDIAESLRKIKEESLDKEIARPGNLEDEELDNSNDLTSQAVNPNGSTEDESERMKDTIKDLMKKIGKENPDALRKVGEDLTALKDRMDKIDLDKVGQHKNKPLMDDALKNIMSGAQPMSSCGAGIYAKFVKLVAAENEVYAMDRPSRKVEGLFGGYTEQKSNKFGTLLCIIDVSGSMDRDLLSKVIYNSFKEISKLDRAVKLDLCVFASKAAWIPNVKPDIASILKVLHTDVGGATYPMNALKLIKQHMPRPKGILICSDYEFYGSDEQKAWNTELYIKHSKVPILNIAMTTASYESLWRYIKDYKPTKFHLWCMMLLKR